MPTKTGRRGGEIRKPRRGRYEGAGDGGKDTVRGAKEEQVK